VVRAAAKSVCGDVRRLRQENQRARTEAGRIQSVEARQQRKTAKGHGKVEDAKAEEFLMAK